ncbi:MAG TPA: hypothetical protein VMF04_00740 [Thermoplasmata archaeon]|nr:hypothetical protein [Thermoplasmata archaeon]
MPVCLHCGEIGADGALFCAKCGYTLPQADGMPLPPPPNPTRAAPPPVATPVAPVFRPPYGVPATTFGTPAAYPIAPGAAPTPPMAPPPSGKYCVRCRTIISRAAIYCPVCQQPQTA